MFHKSWRHDLCYWYLCHCNEFRLFSMNDVWLKSTRFVFLAKCTWSFVWILAWEQWTRLFIVIWGVPFPCCSSMHTLVWGDILLHKLSLKDWVRSHRKNKNLVSWTVLSCMTCSRKFALVSPDLLLGTIFQTGKEQSQYLWLRRCPFIEWRILWYSSRQKQGRFCSEYWVFPKMC